MRTQTKYEEIILEEVRTLPLPVLPQAVMAEELYYGAYPWVSRR